MHKVREKIAKQAKDEVKKARHILKRAEITAEKKEKAKVNTQKKTKKVLFKEVTMYLRAKMQLLKLFT